MSLKTVAGIINILLSVLAPAYIFWRAYLTFEPESFLWWCRPSFGLLLSVMFGVALQNASEVAADRKTMLKQAVDVE